MRRRNRITPAPHMPEPARWATPADNAALRELCRRSPIVGPVSYALEREPDFFALTALQGDDGGRVAVIAEGQDIIAMAMMAPMRAWIGGEIRQSAYLGDLKVDPRHRNSGVGGRVVRFIGDALKREEIAVSSFLVLAGNPMLEMIESGGAHFGVRNLRPIRNSFILFGSPRRPSSGVSVSRASPDDIPEMIELWNRVNGQRSFAPVLDETLFGRWISSSLTLDCFRIARREGRITGFCAGWDATAIKQIRLLRLSPALRVSTAFYNLFAAVTRRPRFPRPGQQLRFLYVAHACAERPEDLESLLIHLHNEHRRAGYLYMDLALDRAGPLAAALRSFRSMKIDFELCEAYTPGLEPGAQSAPADQNAYFDIALV